MGRTYGEREMINAQREAAMRASRYFRARGYFTPGYEANADESPIGEIARRIDEWYPLPKVTRPRVVEAAGYQWRVYVKGISGQFELQYRSNQDGDGYWQGGDTWTRMERLAATHPELLRVWAGLIERPTEVVAEL